MAYKMKSSVDKLCSPLSRTTGRNDVLTKNIKDTSQKGDEDVRPKPSSKNTGPVESKESLTKSRDKVRDSEKAERASSPSGTIFDSSKETQEASEKARSERRSKLDYVKR